MAVCCIVLVFFYLSPATININSVFYHLIDDAVSEDPQVSSAHRYNILMGFGVSGIAEVLSVGYPSLSLPAGDIFLLTKFYSNNNRNTSHAES